MKHWHHSNRFQSYDCRPRNMLIKRNNLWISIILLLSAFKKDCHHFSRQVHFHVVHGDVRCSLKSGCPLDYYMNIFQCNLYFHQHRYFTDTKNSNKIKIHAGLFPNFDESKKSCARQYLMVLAISKMTWSCPLLYYWYYTIGLETKCCGD